MNPYHPYHPLTHRNLQKFSQVAARQTGYSRWPRWDLCRTALETCTVHLVEGWELHPKSCDIMLLKWEPMGICKIPRKEKKTKVSEGSLLCKIGGYGGDDG